MAVEECEECAVDIVPLVVGMFQRQHCRTLSTTHWKIESIIMIIYVEIMIAV